MADPVLYVVERVRVTALRDGADLMRPATAAEVLAHPAVRALVEAGEGMAAEMAGRCRTWPCPPNPEMFHYCDTCTVARWRRLIPAEAPDAGEVVDRG